MKSKILSWFIVLGVFMILFTCASRKRIGAECHDGWDSVATGQGACSWHGGVAYWKHKYWWE